MRVALRFSTVTPAVCAVAATALIGAGPARSTSFAGIVLGAPIATAAALYPQAAVKKVGSISIVRWNRPQGGKLTVYSDFQGVIWQIRFDGDSHEKGSLQIPCGGNFDLQSSHDNLDVAAETLKCSRLGHEMSTYNASDGSIVTATFFGPGDGALESVLWKGYSIPHAWDVDAATIPPAPCTVTNQEAGVIKHAQLDIPPADVQKELAAGAAPDMDVEVLLGPDGSVKRASMYLSSGSDEFDDAAIAAVQNSVYRPKRVGCKPAYGVYQFPFNVEH